MGLVAAEDRPMLRRIVLAALLLVALGCGPAVVTAPPKADPRDTMPATERVRKAVPVLNRTLTQNDLNQLLNYMNQYNATHGRYPKNMAELDELSVSRDLPPVAKAVQSGELIFAGGAGGVLAYEKAALEDRGHVVTTSGVQTMTAAELKQKLGTR
jgi:hypothetical protein